MSGRVLEGIRILDFTRIVAGPFATVVLADLGADVIKIERPGTGDDYRYGPSPKGELSLSFQNTNRGKRSITLDIRVPEGRDIFLRLVEKADAVVENFRSGWLAAQGLAPAVIQERNPRCVVASLSGFGATGPRAGQASYDIVAQATGGLLAMTGFTDGPPVRCGGALADFVGGLYLGLGVVSALLDRDRTGRARVLDLSNQDTVFAITDSAATIMHGIGVRSERVGNQHPFTAPYDAFETTDGRPRATSSFAACATPSAGRSSRQTSGSEATAGARATAGRSTTSCGRGSASAQPTKSSPRWDPRARTCRVRASGDPQLLARGMIERHPHPTLGEVVFHGNPLKFSRALARRFPLAPRLAEHNAEVYAEIGLGDADLARLRETGII
jgi:CoA:oxalate CoA-transferase